MERHFDGQLEDLKKLILVMGGHVEKSITKATSALLEKKVEGFKSVHETEKKINEAQIAVDNSCLALLAKQGPVAKDLRLILSIVKINTDLERMGDQSVNIAHTGKDYLSRSADHDLSDLTKMAELVRQAVKGSLDCFVKRDVDKAREILMMDDEIDNLKNKIFAQMIVKLKEKSVDTEACLDLILIARNLERMGDHATNIAEDVIFAVTGKDVRHGGGGSGGSNGGGYSVK